MPVKLQLKLTSNSGELLSVVTCYAGRISVLRAATPSDLRPYQRALSGSDAKDNLQILCDGSDFRPEQHVTIGFGEPSPTLGLSVKEFLAKLGVSDVAMHSLLLSIGLEAIAEKHCSELSPEQDARLRLIAATTNPEKVVVLNDPFENISNQWRERAAELLANFARSRNAILVIPSLTYRPECWIDNQIVDRIEVGQTSQRTIGFGSAGSQSNASMADLREQLRRDPRFAAQMEKQDSSNRAAPVALAASLAAGINPERLSESGTSQTRSSWPWVVKTGGILSGAGIIGFVAFSFLHHPSLRLQDNLRESPSAPLSTPSSIQRQSPRQPSLDQQPKVVNPNDVVSAPVHAAMLQKPREAPSAFVLDLYPESIKRSVMDTFLGNSNFSSTPPENTTGGNAPRPAQPQQSGNLYSLLQQAGSSSLNPGGAQNTNSNISDSTSTYPYGRDMNEDAAEEEDRRQAIRERFLAAIREAAERRAQADAEYD
jgi:hypothetical protein